MNPINPRDALNQGNIMNNFCSETQEGKRGNTHANACIQTTARHGDALSLTAHVEKNAGTNVANSTSSNKDAANSPSALDEFPLCLSDSSSVGSLLPSDNLGHHDSSEGADVEYSCHGIAKKPSATPDQTSHEAGNQTAGKGDNAHVMVVDQVPASHATTEHKPTAPNLHHQEAVAAECIMDAVLQTDQGVDQANRALLHAARPAARPAPDTGKAFRMLLAKVRDPEQSSKALWPAGLPIDNENRKVKKATSLPVCERKPLVHEELSKPLHKALKNSRFREGGTSLPRGTESIIEANAAMEVDLKNARYIAESYGERGVDVRLCIDSLLYTISRQTPKKRPLVEKSSLFDDSKPSPAKTPKQESIDSSNAAINGRAESLKRNESNALMKSSPLHDSSNPSPATSSKPKQGSVSTGNSGINGQTGNHNRHESKPPAGKKPKQEYIDTSKLSTIVLDDKDVIMGRGGRSNGHSGNLTWHEDKRSLQPKYFSIADVSKRTPVATRLVKMVLNKGGRFVVYDSETKKYYGYQQYYGLSDKEYFTKIREKASQMLRENWQKYIQKDDVIIGLSHDHSRYHPGNKEFDKFRQMAIEQNNLAQEDRERMLKTMVEAKGGRFMGFSQAEKWHEVDEDCAIDECSKALKR